MPIDSKGNKLTTLQLQPGWVIENDGSGLLTSRLTFRCDASVVEAKKPKDNEAHPKDGRLLCHRASYVINENDIATITAEYVGLASGNITKVVITGDNALSSQPIQTHPKFYKGTVGQTGKPLKDLGWDEATQSFPESNSDAISYSLVGIKSYQAPDLQYTGTYYTNSKALLLDNQKMVGKTFQTIAGSNDTIVVPPILAPISQYHLRYGFVTAVNYEQYANVFKVRYTFRVATGGWHSFIYETHN
jgi:hypothetical protein